MALPRLSDGSLGSLATSLPLGEEGACLSSGDMGYRDCCRDGPAMHDNNRLSVHKHAAAVPVYVGYQ